MIWKINIVAAVILTSLTGSILFIGWYLLGRVLEKRDYVNVMFPILRVSMVFFLVPLLYGILVVSDRTVGTFGGGLFFHTPTLLLAGDILFAVWTILVTAAVIYFVIQWIRTTREFSDKFDCEISVQQYFDQICLEMEVPIGKVRAAYSYHATTPFLMGLFGPIVIIPAGNYTDEELRVFFLHELEHYKRRDLFTKMAAIMILITQCWNPMAWLFYAKIEEWSEHACDFKVCDRAGGIKYYYGVITDMSERAHRVKRYFCMTLTENGTILERRIKRMKSYRRPKNCTKVQVSLICALILGLSSVTAFAASVGVANGYRYLYRVTDEAVQEEYIPKVYVEYEESGEEEGIIEEYDESAISTYSSSGSFLWTVGHNVRKLSGTFYASAGDRITVSAIIDPTGKSVDVGIVEPGGNRKYVSGEDDVTHTFELTKTGDYRVFVENNSGVLIEADIIYRIR